METGGRETPGGEDRPDTEVDNDANRERVRVKQQISYHKTESFANDLEHQYCCHRNVFCRSVPDEFLEYEFPWYRQLLLIGVVLFYFIDVGLDVFVASTYMESYLSGRDPHGLSYFIATVFFIVLPNFLIQLVSWFLYFWSYYLCNNEGPLMLRKRFLNIHRHRNASSNTYMVALACHDQSCKSPKESVVPRAKNKKQRSDSRSSQAPMISPQPTNPSPVETQPPVSDAVISPVSTSTHVEDSPSHTIENHEEPETEEPPSSPFAEICEGSRRVRFDNGQSTVYGKESVDFGPKFYPLDYSRKKEFAVISFFHFVVLGFPLRVCRLLWFASRDPFTYFRYRDVSFIRLMEAFLEAAPQAILQLYLMQIQEETVLFYKIITPLSIFSSVVTLSFAVADFASAGKDILAYVPIYVHSKIRPITQDDLYRERMTWTAYFVYIFWQFFFISARVLAISFFAAEYGAYVFVILGTHYAIMVYWMYHQTGNIFLLSDNKGCRFQCGFFKRYLMEFIAAGFNIFFYFSILDNEDEEEARGQALQHTVAYLILMFVENFIMTILWYIAVDFNFWYAHPGLVVVVAFYICAIVFMVVYFWVLSPKKMALEKKICDEFGCCQHLHRSNANRVKRFTSTLNWFFNHDEIIMQVRRKRTVMY